MAASFSGNVKAELCRSFPAKHCCALAECFGILLFCNSFSVDGIRIITESKEFAQALPKLFKKRCIATIHGLDHRRAKWGRFARTYILLGEKCAARFADEIIVLSHGVQQYFKETYGRDTVLIENGVSRGIGRAADQISQNFGLAKDSYILFLGRLVPEKGPHYLIDAFKMVKTDKKLVIAGGSSDTQEFAQQLKAQAAGYAPLRNDPNMIQVTKEAVTLALPEEKFTYSETISTAIVTASTPVQTPTLHRSTFTRIPISRFFIIRFPPFSRWFLSSHHSAGSSTLDLSCRPLHHPYKSAPDHPH